MSDKPCEYRKHEPVLSVFAYGSLLWVQNFIFSRVESGYIQGFKRLFWQESQTHRGTKEKVLTVILNKV